VSKGWPEPRHWGLIKRPARRPAPERRPRSLGAEHCIGRSAIGQPLPLVGRVATGHARTAFTGPLRTCDAKFRLSLNTPRMSRSVSRQSWRARGTPTVAVPMRCAEPWQAEATTGPRIRSPRPPRRMRRPRASDHGHREDDLRYARRRFLTAEAARAMAVESNSSGRGMLSGSLTRRDLRRHRRLIKVNRLLISHEG
jgi:hypothetical protein